MPKLSFDIRTFVEKFDDACKDGTVAKKLAEGMTQLDIGREYRVAEATVRKYLQAHEIIQVRSRRVSKKMKFDCDNMYDDHKKLALAMPWVQNETPRYYFPF
jgi:predicted transcriptional regulator